MLSVLVRGAHAGGGTATSVLAGGALDVSNRIAQEAQQSGSFFQSGSVAPAQDASPPQASTQTS